MKIMRFIILGKVEMKYVISKDCLGKLFCPVVWKIHTAINLSKTEHMYTSVQFQENKYSFLHKLK